MSTERLDKVLSKCGFGTRKDVKRLLHSGVVTIDGSVVTTADFKVDIDKSEIIVDNEVLDVKTHVYIMMNKCQNVVCSTKDGEHQTVLDLLDESYKHDFLGGTLHLVGRLDIDTEGLLLLTTDGKMTHRLTSPKTHISKTYFVRLKNSVSLQEQNEYAQKFDSGLEVPRENNEEAFTAQSAKIQWKNETECLLTIFEGKYHQVKRMFAAVDNSVIFLKRISIGKLNLDPNLETGKYRELAKEEILLLE